METSATYVGFSVAMLNNVWWQGCIQSFTHSMWKNQELTCFLPQPTSGTRHLRLFRRYSCGSLFPESGTQHIQNLFSNMFNTYMVIYNNIYNVQYIYIFWYKPHVCLVVVPILRDGNGAPKLYYLPSYGSLGSHPGMEGGWSGPARVATSSCDFLWQCFLQKKMDGTNLIRWY
jgi:hypothetical protein